MKNYIHKFTFMTASDGLILKHIWTVSDMFLNAQKMLAEEFAEDLKDIDGFVDGSFKTLSKKLWKTGEPQMGFMCFEVLNN